MGLLDALKQYVADSMPGGLLNPEFNSTNGQKLAAELQRGLLESTGINARDKRRAWNRNKLDAVSGSSDTRGSLDKQAYETAMNMAGVAPMGATIPVVSKSGRTMEIVDLPWVSKGYGDSKTYVIRPKSDGVAMKEGSLSIYKNSDGHHLNTVVVDPASRNDGLASLMLEQALKDSGGLYGSTGFSGGGLALANKFGMVEKDGKRFIPGRSM